MTGLLIVSETPDILKLETGRLNAYGPQTPLWLGVLITNMIDSVTKMAVSSAI
jgi:hypothetical protein